MKRLPAVAAEEGLGRPTYFWDTTYPGLGARLNRDDSITWVIKVRIGGKVYWKNLGSWPAMKTKAAQAEVDDMKTRIRKGEDPERTRFIPILWPNLVDAFGADHLPNLKKKSQASYRSALRLHIRPAFPGKMAHEIESSDVRNFHQALGRTGKTRQANVCLGLLSMIFDRAEAWKHRPLHSNPVEFLEKAGYQQFHEDIRDRPLHDDELARLGEALAQMEEEGYGQFCDFVRVLYFSGARRGEVLGLSWDWIDTDRKVITWPDTKTGKISKPLNDALFEVIAKMPRIEGVPWVFPTQGAKKKSESGHLEDIKRPWKRLLTLAGINDLTRHDLRHNVGNHAADEGENLQTVAALLGHRQTSTTERYSKTKGLAASNRMGTVLKRKLKGKIGLTTPNE